MDPRDWQKIKAAFHDAVALPAGARGDILDRALGGDPQLRAEVESLLAAHDATSPIDDGVPGLDDASARAAVPEGTIVGSYRIDREIGRGGMGTVYLARRADDTFEKAVAIKVVRPGYATEGLARRLHAERQILATLDHPNIARLIDAGTIDGGLPYFVMEYVDGAPVTEYCAARALGVGDRVRLFVTICAAVQHAHERLVIHRDLKPSNILVTPDGTPKLLDFGISKVLRTDGPDSPPTETVERLLTPDYASPEQVKGGLLTTASDVYSLGVVLYELLVGERPYRTTDVPPHEAARLVCEAMPVRPSAAITRSAAEAAGSARDVAVERVRRQLAGDLDNVVLMALRKEPERRYHSPSALAADLERHLGGLPVTARPDTFAYRTSKFLRRNVVGVAAGAVVALSVAAGAGTAVWQAGVARAERDRAERRFNDVRALSNSLLFELSPKLERVTGTTEARDVLLARALEYLESLAREAGGDGTLQAELASAFEKVGDLQGNPANPNLVELDRALASYGRARAIREQLVAHAPADSAERQRLAENLRASGNIAGQANDADGALAQLSSSLAITESLIAAAPGSPGLRLLLARVTYDLGTNRSDNKSYAQAFTYFERTLGLLEPEAGVGADPDALKLVGDAHAQYGLALSWEGRQREAEAQMALARGTYERLVATAPDDASLRGGLWLTYWLTSSVYEGVDDALSHEYAAKALAVVEDTVRKDPANIRAGQQLAKSLSRLGETLTRTGHPADALAHLERGAGILRRIVGAQSRNGKLRSELATLLLRLGNARARAGRPREALADLEEARDQLRRVVANAPADRRSRRNLALVFEATGGTYDVLASRARGGEARALKALAAEQYRSARDLLVVLRDAHALAEVDGEFLERMEKRAGDENQ